MNREPRILIVRLSALGDILHTLPPLAALRLAMPQAHIGWLAEEAGAAILEGHPMLDSLHVVPRKAMKKNRWKALRGPMRDVMRDVRNAHYDTAIDFQGLTKSAIWLPISRARQKIGFRGEDAREISWLFYNRRIRPQPEQVHVIEKNLALLRPLGISKPLVEFPIHFKEETKQRARDIWGKGGPEDLRVILNLGAGWKTKQWPPDYWGRLARKLAEEKKARVALAWGPGEEEMLSRALAAANAEKWHGHPAHAHQPKADATREPSTPAVFPLPKTSFTELGATIGQAHLYVGGDTGPTHYAAAQNVPTISIYGASDPKRNGPWGYLDQTIQLTDPPCIPCWQTKCTWKEPLACLTHISVEKVFERCCELLKR